ncbi:MAG: aldose-epimerase [Chitinophagaceae bacterium]|nr:aldose-epimerase [Chitinophagaceae bacterium]
MGFSISVDNTKKYAAITLKDLESGCEAEVYAFGALLNRFAIPVNGKYRNVIDGYESPEDAVENLIPWFKSAFLSPFPGRINNGRYLFNQQQYKIEKFYQGANALHGLVFDAVFEIKEMKESSQECFVILKNIYTGIDRGYPFPYISEIKYALKKNRRLEVTSTVCHFNNEPIPYAEGYHPYFKLGDATDDWSLQLDSNERLEVNAKQIPTGELINDERFLNSTLLSSIEVDDTFKLNKTPGKAAACLKGNGLSVIIHSGKTLPYIQVFIPDHRENVAIECVSGPPDCFNSGTGLMLLEPKEKYSFCVLYEVQAI